LRWRDDAILRHSNLRTSLTAAPLRLKANVNLSSGSYRLDPARRRVPSPGHGWNAMICAFPHCTKYFSRKGIQVVIGPSRTTMKTMGLLVPAFACFVVRAFCAQSVIVPQHDHGDNGGDKVQSQQNPRIRPVSVPN